MKKKIMGLIAVVAIAAVVGYNICTSQNNAKLSALALANVEALARYEYPDVEITCNQSKNTYPGQCWRKEGTCKGGWGWYDVYEDAVFTGNMSDSFWTICP